MKTTNAGDGKAEVVPNDSLTGTFDSDYTSVMGVPFLAKQHSGMTIDAGRELFGELWDVQMVASSKAIKALQKLNELMDDVETFNFAELVRYIEEKTPIERKQVRTSGWECRSLKRADAKRCKIGSLTRKKTRNGVCDKKCLRKI